MNFLVLTCAVFPTKAEAVSKLWIFLESCKKFGVSPGFYGTERTFPGYRIMKLDWQLEALREFRSEYTHVLYTDAWDAFFTAPLTEIISKYEAMGAPPILTSAYIGLGNESDMSKYAGMFDESVRYRYPNVGGYIAEIPAIISAFERMMPIETGDDCFAWYQGWREGWFRPQVDSGCEIFQVGDQDCVAVDGRLHNMYTRSTPCILHLSGGYTSPEIGKDDRMIPWAKRLGII